MAYKYFLFIILSILIPEYLFGQKKGFSQVNPSTDSILIETDAREQLHKLFVPNKVHKKNVDSASKKNYSFVPAIGYTLQTGFAGILSANIAYYSDRKSITKLSSISTSFTYSQYQQIIIPFQANIWIPDNRYNFISDFRFIEYPSDIFGLGGKIDPNQGVTINFSGLKLHQTVMKLVFENLLMGIGYYFDTYWNIRAIDQVSNQVNFQIIHKIGTREIASGPILRIILDTRVNQINPKQGIYASLNYRENIKKLGSDNNSGVLQIDARTYLPFPEKSNNTLALWAYGWLVSWGRDPYLLLPSTGWDDNYNTGRGYIQGRFRGKNMYYSEGEYRFRLLKNGLLGGVAFLNAESFSGELSKTYTQIFLGYGLGLRVKINKHSGTNLCLDYGFGENSSRGFFVNLGEVF